MPGRREVGEVLRAAELADHPAAGVERRVDHDVGLDAFARRRRRRLLYGQQRGVWRARPTPPRSAAAAPEV
ncbi:MAG: hypothetical protein GY772_00380 [bacterium]|nr:hypothetical protein [bacterium]